MLALHAGAFAFDYRLLTLTLSCRYYSMALVTTGDKAGPQQLIRVWPVTVRGGVMDPTEGCILVHKTCHPCCALCNERVDNKGAFPGRPSSTQRAADSRVRCCFLGDGFSKRLYSVYFTWSAKHMEENSVSASLDLCVLPRSFAHPL